MFLDLYDTNSFECFFAAPESVLVMTPRWSSFPKPTIERLSEISEFLEKEGITIFTATEDSPARNPLLMDWIKLHDYGDMELLPSIAEGAGCILVCESGAPIAIQRSTWGWSADELGEWIKSNRSN